MLSLSWRYKSHDPQAAAHFHSVPAFGSEMHITCRTAHTLQFQGVRRRTELPLTWAPPTLCGADDALTWRVTSLSFYFQLLNKIFFPPQRSDSSAHSSLGLCGDRKSMCCSPLDRCSSCVTLRWRQSTEAEEAKTQSAAQSAINSSLHCGQININRIRTKTTWNRHPKRSFSEFDCSKVQNPVNDEFLSERRCLCPLCGASDCRTCSSGCSCKFFNSEKMSPISQDEQMNVAITCLGLPDELLHFTHTHLLQDSDCGLLLQSAPFIWTKPADVSSSYKCPWIPARLIITALCLK